MLRMLIDGNNLLHASDVFPRGKDLSTAAAQQALLAALVAGLSPAELAATVIVFDGPAAVSQEVRQSGLRVMNPRRGQDADEILEQVLENAAETSRLLVVSSDHRIQRAARHVGAATIDSEDYWRQWKQRQQAAAKVADDEKPTVAEDDVQEWLRKFRQAGD